MKWSDSFETLGVKTLASPAIQASAIRRSFGGERPAHFLVPAAEDLAYDPYLVAKAAVRSVNNSFRYKILF